DARSRPSVAYTARSAPPLRYATGCGPRSSTRAPGRPRNSHRRCAVPSTSVTARAGQTRSGRRIMATLCGPGSRPAHGLLDQVEHAAELARRAPGGEVQDHAVVGQLEELGEHLERYVLAQHPGLALALQPVAGGVGDGGRAL